MLELKTKESNALIEMPGLTFQEAKARVLGADRANESIRKGTKEYNDILQLMKVSGTYTKTELINLQNPSKTSGVVEINLRDSTSVNPLRRPDVIIPEKKVISKEEFLSVGVNREAFKIEMLRQKHLRNL